MLIKENIKDNFKVISDKQLYPSEMNACYSLVQHNYSLLLSVNSCFTSLLHDYLKQQFVKFEFKILHIEEKFL